jgi:hypothetical protein
LGSNGERLANVADRHEIIVVKDSPPPGISNSVEPIPSPNPRNETSRTVAGEMADAEGIRAGRLSRYALLIGRAIRQSPNQRLTLEKIYKQMSKYYNAEDSGLHGSIHCTLSGNALFVRQKNPEGESGPSPPAMR